MIRRAFQQFRERVVPTANRAGAVLDVGTASWLEQVTEGSWTNKPEPSWRLRTLAGMRDLNRGAKSPEPGTLVFSRNPKKMLGRFNQLVGEGSGVALLVPNSSEPLNTDLPVLYVEDVVRSLHSMAQAVRGTFDGKVLAVTGSVGKTTVRSMLASVLESQHEVYRGRDNHNGLPTIRNSLLELGNAEYATFEVARTALPTAASLVKPDVAIVTAIAEAHLEDLGTLEDVARIKGKIFRGLDSNGVAILNLDTPYAEVLTEEALQSGARVITYGESSDAAVRLSEYDPSTGKVVADVMGQTVTYRLQLAGRHNALNSLSVLGTLHALGLELQTYLPAIEDFSPVQGRGRVFPGRISACDFTVIDESYNANPTSMRAALEYFGAKYTSCRRVLVLGDMKELGEGSEGQHLAMLEAVIAVSPSAVHLVGPDMKALWDRLPTEIRGSYHRDVGSAQLIIESDIKNGDAVLVKASNGTGLGALVKAWSDEGREKNVGQGSADRSFDLREGLFSDGPLLVRSPAGDLKLPPQGNASVSESIRPALLSRLDATDVLTVDFGGEAPCIRVPRGAEGQDLGALAVLQAGAPTIRLFPSLRGSQADGPGLISERYMESLTNTRTPRKFLERVTIGTSEELDYLQFDLVSENERGTSDSVPAPWNEGSESFAFDRSRQTNSLLIAHELNRMGYEPEWISSGYLRVDMGQERAAFNVSSSHRTSQPAVKTVEDKYVGKQLLEAAGLSVAHGKRFTDEHDYDEAQILFRDLKKVVVKPVDGTKGNGVTVDVTTSEQLSRAWQRAWSVTSRGVVVEEHFSGTEARFLVAGGECVAVARRTSPSVLGDGRSSLRDLINEKNKQRALNPHLYNRPVVLTPERVDRLRQHGLSVFSVLPANEKYIIDHIGGFSTGADSLDITDDVDESYKRVAIEAVQSIPGLEVSGVDIMAEDFRKHASVANHIIVELNSQPGLGSHHFPMVGRSRNAAGKVIASVLKPMGNAVSEATLRREKLFRSLSEKEVTQELKEPAASIARAFEEQGLRTVALSDVYLLASKGELHTSFWGPYSELTGKAGVAASLNLRLGQRLLHADGVPTPKGRLFKPDRAAEFIQGKKALEYARSLGGSATLRYGQLDPRKVELDDENRFREAWSRASLRGRHGILVERQRKGRSIRFLVAYGEVLSVIRGRREGRVIALTDEVHPDYLECAVRAARAFPGLDICEVSQIIVDPATAASSANYRVTTVRSGPRLIDYEEAEQARSGIGVIGRLVELHIKALGS